MPGGEPGEVSVKIILDKYIYVNYTFFMATFTEIKALRLDISDPADYIDIIQVATPATLPASPANQTVYYVTSTGAYLSTDMSNGATESDYEAVELQLSDDRISGWLDTYDHDESVVYALKAILKRLGGQIRLSRHKTGAEDTEFTALIDLYNYYKCILAQQQADVDKADGTNTGQWGQMKQPEIAGGNL